MLKRPHYVALSLVVLATLVVLNLPSGAAARFKLAFSSLFLPLFGLAATAHNAANHGADTVVPRRELLRQNEQLRRANEQLHLGATRAEELARENARLRQLVAWREQSPWKGRLQLARVVLRDPANWWRTVQIDLGHRAGLRPDLPVLTPEGLVGRVATVSSDRAQVVLLGDADCRVAAWVENDARDHGIVGPAGPLQRDLAVLSYLPRSASVKPGQNVVSSGLGGVFPKGILIGKIVDTRPADNGLSQEARVKPAANLSALEEVWVLLP